MQWKTRFDGMNEKRYPLFSSMSHIWVKLLNKNMGLPSMRCMTCHLALAF